MNQKTTALFVWSVVSLFSRASNRHPNHNSVMERGMLRSQVLALGAILGIVCSPISAQAVEWTVGLGAGVAPDYQGSENYELVPRLSTFNADEGFKDVALDASLTYRFVGNWSATGTMIYTRLL